MALPILDQLSAGHTWQLAMLAVCPGPAPSSRPPTMPREVADSGRVWSGAMMVMGFSVGALCVTEDSEVSWTIKQIQKTTCGRLRFKRIIAYGFNFLCSTHVFKHKGRSAWDR